MEPAQLGRGYTGRGMGGASRGAVGGASPEGWGGAMGGAKRGGWGYGRSQQRDGLLETTQIPRFSKLAQS